MPKNEIQTNEPEPGEYKLVKTGWWWWVWLGDLIFPFPYATKTFRLLSSPVSPAPPVGSSGLSTIVSCPLILILCSSLNLFMSTPLFVSCSLPTVINFSKCSRFLLNCGRTSLTVRAHSTPPIKRKHFRSSSTVFNVSITVLANGNFKITNLNREIENVEVMFTCVPSNRSPVCANCWPNFVVHCEGIGIRQLFSRCFCPFWMDRLPLYGNLYVYSQMRFCSTSKRKYDRDTQKKRIWQMSAWFTTLASYQGV